MDAILAQMRAAQGIVEDVSDDDAQTAAGDEFGASTTTASTTPSAEAAYHRAMVSLCAEFASATKERLGGRWYSHFASWLYRRRERPDEPFPRGEDPRRDKELARKLRAAGSTSATSTATDSTALPATFCAQLDATRSMRLELAFLETVGHYPRLRPPVR